MDRDMYLHPATQQNLEALKARGHVVIDPEEGELASGLHGMGRMAEPEHIVTHLHERFTQR
jgi:phosphopantothenoylcysteine decarboxylase/phosphopantothenate--cysteine ligase